MLALEVAILSERGGRPYNEDACGHWHSERQLCCVLADGAGGHGGGDVASRLAVEALLRALAAQPSADGAALAERLRAANRAVRQARVPDTERARMYSTVVCLVVDFVAGSAHWAHSGDSRLYRFSARRLVERTRDHSLVQSLVDAGMLDEAALRAHPNRSELRSALGSEDDELEVGDSGALRAVQPGDAFLLCTDGVWEHVGDERLEELLAGAATPDDWLAAIEREVEAATRARPSHDNFSALAVWADVPAD